MKLGMNDMRVKNTESFKNFFILCLIRSVFQILQNSFLRTLSSDFDETWYRARSYKVTELILNICINYATKIKGVQKHNEAISVKRL